MQTSAPYLGSRITTERRRRYLTTDDLAAALAVPAQRVRDWEAGISQPDQASLQALATLFQIPVEELTSGSQSPFFTESVCSGITAADRRGGYAASAPSVTAASANDQAASGYPGSSTTAFLSAAPTTEEAPRFTEAQIPTAPYAADHSAPEKAPTISVLHDPAGMPIPFALLETPYLVPPAKNSLSRPKAVAAPPVLAHRAGRLLWLPILLVILLGGVLPTIAALVFSFMRYNLLESPVFIGLQNYRELVGDPSFWKALGNTLLLLLTAGGTVLVLGWWFGRSAARLPRPVGMAAGILLGLGGLMVCSPAWLTSMLNPLGHLYSWGVLNPFFLAIPILPLLAPAYLLFYFGYRTGRPRMTWHIAVTLLPLAVLAEWPIISAVDTAAFPITAETMVTGERIDWLPPRIYEGFYYLFIGRSCALLIVLILLTALVLIAAHLAVRAVFRRQPRRAADRLPAAAPSSSLLHWLGTGAALLSGGLLLLLPLFLGGTSWTDLFDLSDWSVAWRGVQEFGVSGAPLPLFGVTIGGFLVVILPTASALVFLPPARAKWIGTVLCLCALCAGVLNGLMGVLIGLWPRLLPLPFPLWLHMLVFYVTNPLLPLWILLTSWVLRTGCGDRSPLALWRQDKKRALATMAALLAAAMGALFSPLQNLGTSGFSLFWMLEGHYQIPMAAVASLKHLAQGFLSVAPAFLILLERVSVPRPSPSSSDSCKPVSLQANGG